MGQSWGNNVGGKGGAMQSQATQQPGAAPAGVPQRMPDMLMQPQVRPQQRMPDMLMQPPKGMPQMLQLPQTSRARTPGSK